MVRMRNKPPGIRTAYYLKPGQTLQNTKVSERALALIVPQSEFERFTEYANESKRNALLAEREAKKLADLRAATYNMSKNWTDKPQNIQRMVKEELLSRRGSEEEERTQFLKEMAAKNSLERAEVVRQARELILYRRPQCRNINRALLASECLRELNAQTNFLNLRKNMQRELDAEYAKSVMEDVEKFHQEEKIKREARLKKIKSNKLELEKQIENNRRDLKRVEDSINKAETEDLYNMTKEIEDIKNKELREAIEKREKLKKMFLEAIEEKKEYEQKLRDEDEFQEKNLKIYREMKHEMEKLAKEKAKNAKLERTRKIEILAKKLGEAVQKKYRASLSLEEKNQARESKEIEESRIAEELYRIEEKKKKKEKARLELQQQIKTIEEEQDRKKKDEMDLKVWETLQRYKRDEYNKEWNAKHLEDEKNKRLDYGKILKKQMAYKEAQRRKAQIEADDSVEIKEMINKANEKVLAYGERVLQESRGVRPTYPIEKAIEHFKRDVGLIPPFKREEETEDPSKISKRKRGRRVICPQPPDEENTLYLA